MSWFPDMGRESMVAVGDYIRTAGWQCRSGMRTRPNKDVTADAIDGFKRHYVVTCVSQHAGMSCDRLGEDCGARLPVL